MATLTRNEVRSATLKSGNVTNGTVVHSTVDYNRFVYDPRNRPIDWSLVQDLFDSITENNLLAEHPIIVIEHDERLVVLDGQHRLEVAKIMETPIHYIVSGKMTFDDVTRVNVSRKSWTNQDYLNRWVREGKTEYIRFRRFVEANPHISQTFARGLCMTGATTQEIRRAFKDGTYVCNNLELAERVADAARTIAPYAEGFASSTYLLIALKALLQNPRYDHEIMLRKLEYQSRKLRKQPDHRAYVENLLEIYNFKSRGPALTIDGATIRNAGQELA